MGSIGMRIRRSAVIAGLTLGVILILPSLAQAAWSWSAPALVDQQAPYDTPNALTSVSCPSTSLCAAVDNKGNVAISTNPTAATPTWSANTNIDGTNRFVAVSCPSTSLCVAVDQTQAFVSTNPTAATPTWTSSGQLESFVGIGGFTGVSCASTSLCVAVDYSDRAVITTDPTDATPVWNGPTSVDSSSTGPLYSVSCPATTLCVAVENGGTGGTSGVVVTTNPTASTPTWTPTTVNGTKGLTSVSCVSSALCVAVDQSGNTVVSTNPTNASPTWTVANVDSTRLISSVSCGSTSLCVAVDRNGNTVISTNPTVATPTWTVRNIAGTQAQSGVSCVSSGSLCVASGGADALISTNPTVATPTWTPTTANSGGTDMLTDISCGSTLLCVAVDPAGRAIISTNPTAGTPTWSVDNVDLAAYPNGVTKISCYATSMCVAIDGSGNALISTNPTSPTPTWSAPASIGAHGAVNGISCPSTTLCVAADNAGYVEISTDPTAVSPIWTATHVDTSSGSSLHVSCASTSLCVAVAPGPSALNSPAFTTTNPTAVTPTWNSVTAGMGLAGVACPSSALCVAADSLDGKVDISTNPSAATPTWSSSPQIDGQDQFPGISCGSTSLCAAVDVFGNVVISTDPTDATPVWSSPTYVDTASTTGYQNEPSGISCITASLCIVSDQGGNVVIGINSTPAPSNITVPTISGTTSQGQTLIEAHGSWTNSPDPNGYSYQWEDCDSSSNSCSAITSATSQTYTLASSDIGHTIRVIETASNAGGPGSPASSAATGVVQAPVVPASKPANTSPPVISGTTTIGQTLSSSTGAWSGTPPISYAYQWQRCMPACSNIAGATSGSYTLTTADQGAKIDVVVTASNSAGSAQATSAAVGPVAAATGSPTLGRVTTSGTAASVSVRCSGPSSSSCSFTLRLTVTETLKGGHVIAVTATKTRKKTQKKVVVVGNASVTIAGGSTKTVKIALNNAGKQLLAGRHTLNVTLAIVRSGQTLSRKTITFKSKKSKKH